MVEFLFFLFFLVFFLLFFLLFFTLYLLFATALLIPSITSSIVVIVIYLLTCCGGSACFFSGLLILLSLNSLGGFFFNFFLYVSIFFLTAPYPDYVLRIGDSRKEFLVREHIFENRFGLIQKRVVVYTLTVCSSLLN